MGVTVSGNEIDEFVYCTFDHRYWSQVLGPRFDHVTRW